MFQQGLVEKCILLQFNESNILESWDNLELDDFTKLYIVEFKLVKKHLFIKSHFSFCVTCFCRVVNSCDENRIFSWATQQHSSPNIVPQEWIRISLTSHWDFVTGTCVMLISVLVYKNSASLDTIKATICPLKNIGGIKA